MKTKIIAVLLLVCVLLVGCDVSKILETLPDKTYTYGDISITLPGIFIDVVIGFSQQGTKYSISQP